MEKLARSFETESDSGNGISRLNPGCPDCPTPKIAAAELSNQVRLATSTRTSVLDAEVFANEESLPKRSSANEVVRIAIKVKGRVLFVDALEVFVAKAQGNYVALVHKSGSYFVRETMATAEQKLTPLGFVRIHRCTLVNAILVKDLRRENTGTYVLRTTDGREHPVGRAYKGNLKAIARSWMGFELI
jgi:DNA-binding LytR/AlgR family response regulator